MKRLPQRLDLGAEGVGGPGVVDHRVGPAQSFLAAGLGGDPLTGLPLGEATGAHQASHSRVLGAVHDHHVVDPVRPPGLDQQGYDEHHRGPGAGQLAEAGVDLGGYRRVDEGVEVGPGLGVGEHQPGEGGSVDLAAGADDRWAEPAPHSGVGRPVRLDHVPGDEVGVDDDRAHPGEHVGHRGLARPDASCQPDHTDGRPYHRVIRTDPHLYAPDPAERLRTAQGLSKRARRAVVEKVGDWPPFSPGAANAWLLLATTKPPSWRDTLLMWPETPLAVGEPHEGFFYPDPRGFWAEVRRWSVEVFRGQVPTWGTAEALSLTALVHVGDEPERLRHALAVTRPRTVIFLDGPSWERSGLDVGHAEPHYIYDPHRAGQVYEGFWGRTPDGVVIGKAPQHPSTHNLYRAEDMLGYLRSAPSPEGV